MGKLTSIFTSKKLLIALVGIVVIAGVVWHFNSNKPVAKSTEYPEYVNVIGSYLFTVPKNYVIDDQAISGAQLVFTGSPAAKTLEDVYKANGISVQPTSDQTDKTPKGFKDYVNKTFVSKAKSELSATDAKVKFIKTSGQDAAIVTLSKDGKILRVAYLQNGQHPVIAIANAETDAFKKIEHTIKDVESSDLKDSLAALKDTLQASVALIKGQDGHDLYVGAATDLKSKTSEAQLTDALKAATNYTSGSITSTGITYQTDEFSSVLKFTPTNKDVQAALGALTYKKINGQWQLELISLPKNK